MGAGAPLQAVVRTQTVPSTIIKAATAIAQLSEWVNDHQCLSRTVPVPKTGVMIAPEGFCIMSWRRREIRRQFGCRLIPELVPFYTVKEWVPFQLVDRIIGTQTFVGIMYQQP
jgi:hypothetical protein